MKAEELARKIYLEREEANERIESERVKKEAVEEVVMKILEIFNISNQSKKSTVLVWAVRITKQEGSEFYCNPPMVSFEIGGKNFSNRRIFGPKYDVLGNNAELGEYMEEMRIPTQYYKEIMEYFQEHLSDYFSITQKDGEFRKEFIIELKRRDSSKDK